MRLLKFTQILRGLHSFVCFPFKSMVFFLHRRLFRMGIIEMNATLSNFYAKLYGLFDWRTKLWSSRLTCVFSLEWQFHASIKTLLSNLVFRQKLFSSWRRRTVFWSLNLHLNLFIVIQLLHVLLRSKTKHSYFRNSLQIYFSWRMALF